MLLLCIWFSNWKTYTKCTNKLKNKKYHTVGTIPKSNRNIAERGKNDSPNTQIHDRALSKLDTDTSIKSVGAKLVSWALVRKWKGHTNADHR